MSNTFTCKAKVDLPYPAVRAGEANPAYAEAMLSNVGGSNSEMTAVSLYIYNSLAIPKPYDQFGPCFEQIAITEMHHLDIFGELAEQLGADPRLWECKGCKCAYWTPAYNDYPREICEMIRNSIKSERAAIRKYKRQAQCIHNANIVENLRRIILDEELHIRTFSRMYEQACCKC